MNDQTAQTAQTPATVPFTGYSNHTPAANETLDTALSAKDFKDADGWNAETNSFATYAQFNEWYSPNLLDADGKPSGVQKDRRATVQAMNFDMSDAASFELGPINVVKSSNGAGKFPTLFLTHTPPVDDVLQDKPLARTLAALGMSVQINRVVSEVKKTLKRDKGIEELSKIDFSPMAVFRALSVLQSRKAGLTKIKAFAKYIFDDVLQELEDKVKDTDKAAAFKVIVAELKGHLSVPDRPYQILETRDALRQTTPDHIHDAIISVVDNAVVKVVSTLIADTQAADSDEIIYAKTTKGNNKTVPLNKIKSLIDQRPHTSYISAQVGTNMDDLAAILSGNSQMQTIDSTATETPVAETGTIEAQPAS